MPFPDRPVPIPDRLRQLIGRLISAGYEAYLVGGFLRDLILGRPTHDYDLATSATPEEVTALFADYRILPIGLAHGTVTVMDGDFLVEVTTFRKEGVYSDFRHPDQVWFTDSIEDDLARRDFTINAMAWHPAWGWTDPWGGLSDLDRGLIRAVGDPGRRFGEDALRIVRALRFAAELGFEIEEATLRAMEKKADLLRHLAPERLRIELERLLVGPWTVRVLDRHAGLMAAIIPELHELARQKDKAGRNLYQVALDRLAAVSVDPVRRLAALLYDVEDVVCAGSALSVGRRLRFSNQDLGRIDRLAVSRELAVAGDERTVWRLLHRWGKDAFFEVLELWQADAGARGSAGRVRQEELESVAATARRLVDSGRTLGLADLQLDGHDLAARGYRGAEIGQGLETLLERVCVDGLPNEREALLRALEETGAGRRASDLLHP